MTHGPSCSFSLPYSGPALLPAVSSALRRMQTRRLQMASSEMIGSAITGLDLQVARRVQIHHHKPLGPKAISLLDFGTYSLDNEALDLLGSKYVPLSQPSGRSIAADEPRGCRYVIMKPQEPCLSPEALTTRCLEPSLRKLPVR